MIVIILLSALVLRLISLTQSLWLDEAININNVVSLNYLELYSQYSLGDFHPPLFHLILKFTTSIIGASEIATRMPSVFFGVLTVFITYKIGKQLFENKTALIAATLLATSPLHIYYSQEARMYSLAAFLIVLSVYFFIKLYKQKRLLNWLGFIIATALTLYTDYLPYTIIPVFLLAIFIQNKKFHKNSYKNFVPAFLLIFILLIPWLLIFPKQLSVGLAAAAASPAWSSVVGAANLQSLLISFVKFTIGRISIDNNFIFAFIFAPIAIYISLLFTLSLLRISTKRIIIWLWFFIPLLLGFIMSFFVPVFAFFRFIFILPAFYLILAAGINVINSKKLFTPLFFIALLINFVSTTIYLFNSKFHRENWRDATEYIISNSTENTIVLFEQGQTIAPFEYYNKGKVMSLGALNGFSADPLEIRQKLIEPIKGRDKIFLFQYLSGITDPQGLLFKEISNTGFINVTTRDFNGVGFVYEFKKNIPQTPINIIQ